MDMIIWDEPAWREEGLLAAALTQRETFNTLLLAAIAVTYKITTD